MTLTDPTLRMTFIKIMSNYWTVFGVVSALVVCLVLEVSIVNVSGFSTPHNSATDIPIFSALGIFSIISQFIILNFVYTKNVPFEKSSLRIMYKAIVSTQLAIIIILVMILIEINFILSYYLIHLELMFIISSVTAVAVMIPPIITTTPSSITLNPASRLRFFGSNTFIFYALVGVITRLNLVQCRCQELY